MYIGNYYNIVYYIIVIFMHQDCLGLRTEISNCIWYNILIYILVFRIKTIT